MLTCIFLCDRTASNGIMSPSLSSQGSGVTFHLKPEASDTASGTPHMKDDVILISYFASLICFDPIFYQLLSLVFGSESSCVVCFAFLGSALSSTNCGFRSCAGSASSTVQFWLFDLFKTLGMKSNNKISTLGCNHLTVAICSTGPTMVQAAGKLLFSSHCQHLTPKTWLVLSKSISTHGRVQTSTTHDSNPTKGCANLCALWPSLS